MGFPVVQFYLYSDLSWTGSQGPALWVVVSWLYMYEGFVSISLHAMIADWILKIMTGV